MNTGLDPRFRTLTLKNTGASDLWHQETLQSLWGGYGELSRYGLEGGEFPTVVAKHVRWPVGRRSGRTQCPENLSHQRKVRSYQVELAWYRHWSSRCAASLGECRIPQCLAQESSGDEVWLVLEDLDGAGYGQRRSRVKGMELQACLRWLAHFHALFLGESPRDLWKVGTYWHLATRPQELAVLRIPQLRDLAAPVDAALRASPFQTFVHGDAKLANFCFSRDGHRVAAVDFQYVGGGCGMKDVAYLLDSCFGEDACAHQEGPALDYYFVLLRDALRCNNSSVDASALEENWRSLYPLAWTDLQRFLHGWSPGSWPFGPYSQRMAAQATHFLNS